MQHANFNLNDKQFTVAHMSTGNSIRNQFQMPYSFPEEFINKLNEFVFTPEQLSIAHFHNYNHFYFQDPIISESISPIASYSACIKSSKIILDSLKSYLPTPLTLDSVTQPYPIAVRYTDSKRIWLIERPPFKATVSYKKTRASLVSPVSEVDIWMPWTVMFLVLDPEQSSFISYLFFNDGPINSLDDVALPCFHMNMYDDGKMCLNHSYTMLQQYLAEENSYDVSSVYNFILNDYMAGGWNADLGLNVFDRLSSYTNSMSKVKSVILSGDKDLKMKDCFTQTGKVSPKKYYTNYFKYFSTFSLDQMLSLIKSVKQDLTGSSRGSTYSKLIASYNRKPDSILNDTISFNYNVNSMIDINFRLFFHTDLASDINDPDFVSNLHLSIQKYIELIYASDIKLMIYDNAFITHSFDASKNLFIDSDLSINIMDEHFDYDKLFNLERLINVNA